MRRRLCLRPVVQFSHTCHHDSRSNEQKTHKDVKSTSGKQRRHDGYAEDARIWVIFPYLTDHFGHNLSSTFDGARGTHRPTMSPTPRHRGHVVHAHTHSWTMTHANHHVHPRHRPAHPSRGTPTSQTNHTTEVTTEVIHTATQSSGEAADATARTSTRS